MDNPITTPLPADLPESWTTGQIVAPNGADVGLSEQHGYNYLMEQVNAAQAGVNTLGAAFEEIPELDESGQVPVSQLPVGDAGGVAGLGDDGKVPVAQLPAGEADGVASLGGDGKVPETQLPPPSTVVDVPTTTTWTSQSTTAGTEYWEQSVTVPGLGTSDQVDISLDADGLNQLLTDGVTALWAENTDGACVIKALGAAPTVALTLHLTLTEVSST